MSDRLTIVHLLEPGGAGVMRHVIDLVEAQQQAGHHVHVIYSTLRLDPLYEAQLKAVPDIHLYPLAIRRAPHLDDITVLSQVHRILKIIQPDILHGHSTKAGMLARLSRLFTKAKIIYTPHAMLTLNPEINPLKKMIYGWYEKLLSPFMQCMITLSSFEYDHAKSFGISFKKVKIVFNGIRPFAPGDRVAIREKWKLDSDAVVIGFVGRLADQKNPLLAIQSFALAFHQNPNLYLALIGDGELKDSCDKLAHELSINHRIIWCGAVDARKYYAAMDMLLVTSRYEGMAYIFIEALYAGLPIITTPVGGSDSCVIQDQTGMIVNMSAPKIAQTITDLAKDAPMRDAMKFAAAAHAQNFTIEKMANLIEKLYREA